MCFNIEDVESKTKNIRLKLSSADDAIKSLDRLFGTLGYKKPMGDLLDLTNLDEELVIEENNKEKEGVE